MRALEVDGQTEGKLRLVEAILAEIKGFNPEDAAAARVRWLVTYLPRTAALLGIDRDTAR